MNRTIFALLVCLLGLACDQTAASDVFPRPENRSDEFRYRQWYPPILEVMREPSLWQQRNAQIEQYRFLYLPSFHQQISVRVTNSSGTITLRATQLDGHRGWSLATERNRVLTSKEWARFQTLLGRAGYWTTLRSDPEGGIDGSQWVLEASGVGRYRIVEHHSPPSETRQRGLGPFVAVCKYLLRLSDLTLDERLY
jgi:hypothetical protein